MTPTYPRYELTVTISKRIKLDESKMIVQTTTGIPDTEDFGAVMNAAEDLVRLALFEGWDEVLNETS